jgi:two-component system, chemotaxis family, protein-glutamate methylesterase/glutaminase
LEVRGGGRTDIVVVGASAGGVQALKTLVGGLPPDYPGSVFIVLHTSPDSPGTLDAILTRAGPLPVSYPRNGDPIEPGRVYVASPDQHLIVRPGHVHLTRGPRENASRPAINPLFRSAARAYGPRVVGVILSGTLDDGVAGLIAVEEVGGVTIVQDPEDADFREMPENALAFVDADFVGPAARIPAEISRLAHELANPSRAKGDLWPPVEEMDLILNQASGYSCPECHGSLWQVSEGQLIEYRCRTGHLYSPETLLHHLSERSIEEMESTLRALEEEASASEHLAARAQERGIAAHRADRYRRRAKWARERASAIARAIQIGDESATAEGTV